MQLFTISRGGISKATRMLHLTEDVFCGCNHILRGGRVRYKEYISCGKVRPGGRAGKGEGGRGGAHMHVVVWAYGAMVRLQRTVHTWAPRAARRSRQAYHGIDIDWRAV